MTYYDNTSIIVVVLVALRDGLLIIRHTPWRGSSTAFWLSATLPPNLPPMMRKLTVIWAGKSDFRGSRQSDRPFGRRFNVRSSLYLGCGPPSFTVYD
jgi:hypothetical protein